MEQYWKLDDKGEFDGIYHKKLRAKIAGYYPHRICGWYAHKDYVVLSVVKDVTSEEELEIQLNLGLQTQEIEWDRLTEDPNLIIVFE